jgi:hypothetical protein
MPIRIGIGLGIIPPSWRPAPSGPPVNVRKPGFTGILTEGQTVSIDYGDWTNLPDPAFTSQVQSDGADVSGGTSSTYTWQAGDVGPSMTVDVEATNSEGSTSATSDPVTIAAALSISGTPGSATVGSAYSFTPTTSGGHTAYSFALTGTLPAGLSFSTSTGAITGTPTGAGTTSGLNITVTDADGLTDSLGAFSISVGASGGDSTPDAFSFTDVPGAEIATRYQASITLSGMTAAGPVTVTNGVWWKLNTGDWQVGTGAPQGTASNGDTITLSLMSSSVNSTAVGGTLNVNGVTDTFTVTTVAQETETTTVVAAMVTAGGAPSTEEQGLLDRLIRKGKAHGWYAKCERICNNAGFYNPINNRIDLKTAAGVYTDVNGTLGRWLYTASHRNEDINVHAATGFNPGTAAGKLGQNDNFTMAGFPVDMVDDQQPLFGDNFALNPRNASGFARIRNSAGTTDQLATTHGQGIFGTRRTASTGFEFRERSGSFQSVTRTSAAHVNREWWIQGWNTNSGQNFGNRYISFAMWGGSSITDAEWDDAIADWTEYLGYWRANQPILVSNALTDDGYKVTAHLPAPSSSVRLLVATNPFDFSDPVYASSLTSTTQMTLRSFTDGSNAVIYNHRVTFAPSGLEPSTQYYQVLEIDGAVDVSGVHKVKTAPALGSTETFKFTVGSCSNHHLNNYVAGHEAIGNADALFHLQIGDWPYIDDTNTFPTLTTTTDLATYRHYLLESLRSASARKLIASKAVEFIYSDHDGGSGFNDATWDDCDGPAGSNNTGFPTQAAKLRQAWRDICGGYTRCNELSDAANPDHWLEARSFVIGKSRFVMCDGQAQIRNNASFTKTIFGHTSGHELFDQVTWIKGEIDTAESDLVNNAFLVLPPGVPGEYGSFSTVPEWAAELQDIVDYADAKTHLGAVAATLVISGDDHNCAVNDGSWLGVPVYRLSGMFDKSDLNSPNDPAGDWNGATGSAIKLTGNAQTFGLFTVNEATQQVSMEIWGADTSFNLRTGPLVKKLGPFTTDHLR